MSRPKRAADRPRPETRAVVEREVSRPGQRSAPDRLVVEEPLEVRVDGAPLAVLMRTPGDDFELAAGFLLSEGVVEGAADVAGIAFCRDPAETGPTNVVSVATPDGRGPSVVEGRRRAIVTSSACGLCGRVTLDEVERACPKPDPPPPLSHADLARAVRALAEHQTTFESTGAAHGAVVVSPAGEVVAAFEDVGRHNAVDKCVGRLLLAGALPLSGHLLAVSGRLSFEIVQKARVAGLPAVCGVGAATQLAVDLARRSGMLLAGFVREGRCTVYAGGLA